MDFTDWHTYQIEKRQGEEDALRKWPAPEPPTPHCLKCGWAIDTSKHFGRVWYFDHGTETIHVCRESYRLTMARIRRAAENER